MNIGKLISMFVVSCLLALSLAMGANVNAQTKGAKLTRTSATQMKSHKMGKKKAGKPAASKFEYKKAGHRRG
jgi:hypothetical protein